MKESRERDEGHPPLDVKLLGGLLELTNKYKRNKVFDYFPTIYYYYYIIDGRLNYPFYRNVTAPFPLVSASLTILSAICISWLSLSGGEIQIFKFVQFC